MYDVFSTFVLLNDIYCIYVLICNVFNKILLYEISLGNVGNREGCLQVKTGTIRLQCN